MDMHPPSPALLDALRSLIYRRDDSSTAFDVFKQDETMSHSLEVKPAAEQAIEDAAATAASEIDAFDGEIAAVLRSASDNELHAAYDAIDDSDHGASPEATMLKTEIQTRRPVA